MMASGMIVCSFGLMCLALIDWATAGCGGDFDCRSNERCSSNGECEVTENTNHEEGVKCYLDSYCKSEYVCDNGVCEYKGKNYEHLTDKVGGKGACTDDKECPSDYFCKLDRHTCYKRTQTSISDAKCIPSSSCSYNYHCCQDQICSNKECVASPASERRHIQSVTCNYIYHCPSEYLCHDYTCYYAGEEHAHVPYRGIYASAGNEVYCTYDSHCPSGYFCKEDTYTCYESKDTKDRSSIATADVVGRFQVGS